MLDTVEILAAVKDKLAEDDRYEARKGVFLNFALKEIMNRLGLFRSYDGYKALYDALREWGYRKLDLLAHDDLLEDIVEGIEVADDHIVTSEAAPEIEEPTREEREATKGAR